MKLAQGVDLHLLKTEKFKNNHLTIRFSGQRQLKNLAQRVLVAQMLATANASYPTSQLFREKLASLYGATFSTNLSTRGQIHILDIDMTFISDRYSFHDENLLSEMLDFLQQALFHPLITVQQYQSKTFDLEKANLINYLEADKENHFYYSDLELQKLYFLQEEMRYSKYASADLLAEENSYTAYQEFQRMLKEDKIDIFLLGDFDDYQALQLVNQMELENRQVALHYQYQQDYVNITQEKIEKRENSQSVLQLAYHLPFAYGDQDYYHFLVFNGLFGAFSHSKLFTVIREEEGLAYSIASHFDIFSALLKVYTGIDKKNRRQVLKSINNQLNDIRLGRFSSQLLKQTKKMLITNANLAEDHPKNQIELAYNQQVFADKSLSLQEWIDRIEAVTKEDIRQVASQIKLQSIYFLEGE